ncbi:uncharacterized protein A1O9_08418 [Exophiala aquamarina CBS 119918]|uniref:Uncharacterized protein n=1 Tax=Exophiala aquamarina CBS 119918 TaxID=1182545 RepID=A0A072P8R8_9EURO|nr:uncharacterized protein A1O9_08418 [Exophiala aquamarina CBS 119918]KEF55668.1 hypothetical protein A1O9_08418 [Exophiala aquamarina CBS 119918]
MATVNRPTDTAVKEKDINQKLQLYGIYQAFANGKVPSNQQIDIALNSILESKALASPSKRLSSEGQSLVADVKEVVEQAKYLLLSKNEGDLLQDFIWDTQHLDGSNAKLPGAPTDKATAQQHGNQALDGLKTLGRLIISNGQFRKLLSDASILARDIAGDAAQKAANQVNPSDEQMSQIDRPAEDNTWHDVPDLSKENIRTQARSAFDKNAPVNKEEAQNAGQHGLDTAQAHPAQHNREAGRAGLGQAIGDLKAQAQANIPEEDQENAKKAKNATVQKSRNYLSKKMPEDRREQTIWRLKKMVVEIQGHSDYQQAIDTLLSLAETYGGHATDVTTQSKGTVKGAHTDDSLKSAEANLKILIERFANSTSTDDFFDALNQIYRDADRDPELKNWFKSANRLLRKTLQEQGYILQDTATDEWNRLVDQGRFLFRDRYRDHTDRILDELKFLADQFDQDPQNKAFGDAVQKLFLDLGNDDNGKPTFKPHLVKDLTEVILPAIFENTRYVPIPRIEVSDPMVDVVVENLVVESDNLFPNVFEFGSDNYWRVGRKKFSNKKENKIMISGSGCQMDLKDVAYYVKRKQGFPSITDKGVMDIFLGGEGFSFKIAARNAQKSDRTHFVVVDNVDVSIKNLSVKVKQSNHKLLFAIAKPLLLKTMKPAIQKVLEKQIKDSFQKADAFAWSVHQDVQRSIEAAKNDPENAPNIYQSYVNSLQKQMTEKKKKAEAVASKTNVNVAVTQEDSIFKNISLPGGISSKATEYKKLAAKGDRWESPVFSIGSAKASTNIPKLAQVKRKAHATTTAGIRGGNHPNAHSDVSRDGVGGTGTASSAAGYGTVVGQPGSVAVGRDPNLSGTGAAHGSGFFGGNQVGVPTAAAGGGFSTQVEQAFDPNKNIAGPGVGGVGNGSAAGTYHDNVTRQ